MHDPDTLSEEIQSAAAPTKEEEETEDFIDAQDSLDHLHPVEWMREDLRHWIDTDPDLATTTSIPSPAPHTPIADISSPGDPDTTIEGQMALAQEEDDVVTAGIPKGPADEQSVEDGRGGGSRNVPYGQRVLLDLLLRKPARWKIRRQCRVRKGIILHDY